jgi:hypothetical protein
VSACLLPRQLLAADFLQGRRVVTHHAPQHIVRDMLGIVAQYISDAGNLRPRNVRVPGFQLVAEMTAGFGDDFNPRSTIS